MPQPDAYDQPAEGGELECLVRHVAFEVAALRMATDLHRERGYWIHVETILLHARNLREFFFDRWEPLPRPKAKGVYAEDYFSEATEWRSQKGKLPCKHLDGPTLEAINAQLSHISRNRVEDPFNLVGKAVKISREIVACWDCFLQALEGAGRNELVTAFREEHQEMCQKMGVESRA